MNQVILFSPVGGTDPISAVNYRDGSLLHICRVYKPSKVILYMSAEVLEYHEKDNRYLFCLDRLSEQQNRKMEYEVIERRELKSVQEFDFFYQDFRSIVQDIFTKMDETDTLILNISSGTPAMKSGLLVLRTLGEFPCKMVQVITPARKMNEHIHKGFEVEVAWGLNEDNEEGFENRCREVQCPTLDIIKKEEIIKKHVEVYDYGAALSVARTMPGDSVGDYYDMLQMAERRLLLDFKEVDRIMKGRDYNCFPVRESGKRKRFEYALSLQVKLWREEYADFIRAITPMVVDLLEMVLKNQCRIDIDQFCRYKTKKVELKKKTAILKVRVWDAKKLKGTEIGEVLKEKFRGDFKAGAISSFHLKSLLEAFSDNRRIIDLAEDLRQMEEAIRNLAAHEIVSVTADTIIEKTGFTGKQIMDKIKEMFAYTEIHLKSGDWNAYNDMNEKIIRCMRGQSI